MKVAFRVDGSRRIGTGHISRCLTLASELRRRGIDVTVVSRELEGHVLPRVRATGIRTVALPEPDSTSVDDTSEDYAEWLGVPQARDASETVQALAGSRPDLLVVDHYGLDVEWETHLRPHVGRLMVIDDLADRPHECDVLVDPSYPAATNPARYAGLVSEDCVRLLGPRYAPLQRRYRNLRPPPGKGHSPTVRRTLIYFGGSDLFGLTPLVLKILSEPSFRRFDVDVVIGPNVKNPGRIHRMAAERGRTHIHGSQPSLIELMLAADLAIGAGGVTMLERMCIGVPSVVVSVAANQREACGRAAADGIVDYVGDATSLSEERLRNSIRTMTDARADREAYRLAGQLAVDGLGCLRVGEAITPTGTEELTLRRAQLADLVIHFDWANEPITRRNAKHSAPIPWVEHVGWYTGKLLDPHSRLFVMMAGELPVGQIRFDHIGAEAWISYSLDPLVRGRGWGKELVSMGLQAIAEEWSCFIRADVSSDNEPSRRVFEGLGFRPVDSSHKPPGFVSYSRAPSELTGWRTK